jgi:hypothetical protein
VSVAVAAVWPSRSRRPKWKTTRPDADNTVKLVLDCMTAAGWLSDDAVVCSVTLRKATGPEPFLAVAAAPALDGFWDADAAALALLLPLLPQDLPFFRATRPQN